MKHKIYVKRLAHSNNKFTRGRFYEVLPTAGTNRGYYVVNDNSEYSCPAPHENYWALVVNERSFNIRYLERYSELYSRSNDLIKKLLWDSYWSYVVEGGNLALTVNATTIMSAYTDKCDLDEPRLVNPKKKLAQVPPSIQRDAIIIFSDFLGRYKTNKKRKSSYKKPFWLENYDYHKPQLGLQQYTRHN